jgi:hypothetical protein
MGSLCAIPWRQTFTRNQDHKERRIMKVYQAINAIQLALSKTGISKDRVNSQGSGYKFRGIDDVYNAISPLLAEHGLCILPRMLSRECTDRISAKGGNLFYVTVEAEFDFVSAEDGSKHTVKTFGEAMDSGDKATNKAMSAAYKYAAFQAFAIPTEGDNDADAQTHYVEPLPDIDLNVMLDHLAAIESTTTEEDLRKVYAKAYAYASGSPQWQKKIVDAKDKMKGKL